MCRAILCLLLLFCTLSAACKAQESLQLIAPVGPSALECDPSKAKEVIGTIFSEQTAERTRELSGSKSWRAGGRPFHRH
jgi:hypothetical protein